MGQRDASQPVGGRGGWHALPGVGPLSPAPQSELLRVTVSDVYVATDQLSPVLPGTQSAPSPQSPWAGPAHSASTSGPRSPGWRSMVQDLNPGLSAPSWPASFWSWLCHSMSQRPASTCGHQDLSSEAASLDDPALCVLFRVTQVSVVAVLSWACHLHSLIPSVPAPGAAELLLLAPGTSTAVGSQASPPGRPTPTPTAGPAALGASRVPDEWD